jgi:hypothetical protein
MDAVRPTDATVNHLNVRAHMQDDDDRRLDSAVSLGIITAAQAAEIRALTPVRAAVPRLPHAIGAESIGYVLGAITVVVAMGWFLADRWDWLGASGVLAVAVLYAALFLVVGWRLRREGASIAANLAVLLSVTMVPVAVVSVNELMGWFANAPGAACSAGEWIFWRCRGEEIVVEFATVMALVAVLRATRFSLAVLPLAALSLRFVFHAATFALGAPLGGVMSGWIWLICTSLLVAVAYETSRRQGDDEDFALWLHLVGAFSAMVASAMLINQVEWYRHLLVPAAFMAFAFSLRMRRFVWTLLGLGWFVSYLGWLAADVFRDTPFFPIILAALGVGVIVATVWIQRNSARLVARFGGLASDGRPSFPGGVALILVPIVAAVLQLPSARALDRASRRESDAAQAQARRQMEARTDSIRRAGGRESLPIETKAPPQP